MRIWTNRSMLAAAIAAAFCGGESRKGTASEMTTAACWTVFELVLESQRDYENPFWDVDCAATFVSPSGAKKRADAFWDGGRTWRVRFCPGEIGEWRYETTCSNPADGGLGGQAGRFECVAYTGDNPLYLHGPVRLSDNRRHLAWTDGEPFFWLGDTAWNGALRAEPRDWEAYLALRRKQGFSVIQYVCTQWRGAKDDRLGEQGYIEGDPLKVNPEFFQRIDAKARAVNEHGLVGAPVNLWALTESDPGRKLPLEAAIRLGRYIAARLNALHVVWLLGGDGHYDKEFVERWRAIGRGVFGEDRAARDRVVSLHPCGQSWVGDIYRSEPWFDLIGYQSGHGFAKPEQLRWLVVGPPASNWSNEPVLPVINQEPNYEAHPGPTGVKYGAFEVRRAVWWSLLVSPTAGVTYGHNAIWPWNYKRQEAEGHARLGEIEPYTTGLETEGIAGVMAMQRLFEGLEWWKLIPAPEALAGQPGEEDPRLFVALAAAEDGSFLLAYSPAGAAIAIRPEALPAPFEARWLDPRSGAERAAKPQGGQGVRFDPPSDEDWALSIRRKE